MTVQYAEWLPQAEVLRLAQQVALESGLGMQDLQVARAPFRVCPLGAHVDHQVGLCELKSHLSHTMEICIPALTFPTLLITPHAKSFLKVQLRALEECCGGRKRRDLD